MASRGKGQGLFVRFLQEVEELEMGLKSVSADAIRAIPRALGTALQRLRAVVAKTRTLSMVRRFVPSRFNGASLDGFLLSPVYSQVAHAKLTM